MKKNLIFCFVFLGAIALRGQTDRSQMPEPGPAPEINLQDPQRFELRNGLKVLVVENHKLPRVTIQLLLDNPPIKEGEKAGVSSLVGSLMGNGSENIPKDEFNEEVDFLGATINFGAQSAFAQSLSTYFPRILELMSEAALYPDFTEEEFQKEKDKLLTSLKAGEKDVGQIAGRVQRALAYGKEHPYGEFTTEETVNNVSLYDVQEFYRNYFVPANAYLVVIGDVSFDQVRELVDQYFTPWTKAAPPSFSYTEPSDAQYTQINFVDMPNAVQSEIAVQNLVELQMNDPDYLAALVANRILGGGGEARLFLNLREDKGYTYGSYSQINNDKYGPARFRATASVRNQVTDSSVVEILKEIKRIREEPVSESELEVAKAKYTGSFVLALEQPATMARYALNIETENLPADYYKTYLERLGKITREDVQQAARKYFEPSNARVVVAGKGSEVLENLENVTFEGRKIPVKYYNKEAEPVDRPDYEAAVPEGVTVQSVIDRYFEAIGGREAVGRIESLKLVYQGNVMGSAIRIEEVRTADRFAQTTFMNDNAMMGVVAKGDELYMKQGGNKVPLPEQMKQDMMQVVGVFPEQAVSANPDASLAGTEEVDGKPAYRIDVPGQAVQTSYFYDVETGLKVKEASVVSMNGQTQNQETLISDYQEVEGILFPSMKSQAMGPQQVETTLLEAVVNYQIQDSDFD
ncbi:M16 family metallopeptidase [Robiginitalea biformata]|uniref:Processing protease n=1 Tax=Robiginitalea biformata (strain ATCC BAA-864 / DSM 15991 / KCTC 12146 / HTCC2501) TaxID=313596 RepID=A4CIU1_ROBBH|nr:insulinase family protein [Robiginitalea biformata]EAR16849.1 processing protease [Robiginitalea biformata HTCC2501]